MEIPGVAQGCHPGNQAEFVIGPHMNLNQQKHYCSSLASKFSNTLLYVWSSFTLLCDSLFLLTRIIDVSVHGWNHFETLSGWRYTSPSEKHKSQLGWFFPTEWNGFHMFQTTKQLWNPLTSLLWSGIVPRYNPWILSRNKQISRWCLSKAWWI